ncbi:DUF11 domain-containing protein [Microbacterium sp. Leaf320]|uniref:DUF7927 domain-containing protein n=1 Tax=Microbacterium sp. Leaf320 TaxID=1736334 RepID=UPI000712D571|nr:DUF11 domain-containing protein [Microbacterium sp. Leaf320]KQQ65333.1 hypothetical protein ASF63_15440 [Microbacterium sp. Leaf320]
MNVYPKQAVARGERHRGPAPLSILAPFALLLAVLATILTGPAPHAQAEANVPGVPINNTNVFYAYATTGETIDVAFTKVSNIGTAGATQRFQAFDPTGALAWTCTVPGSDAPGTVCAQTFTATTPGAWKITSTRITALQASFTWAITANNAGTPQPGRVWTNQYTVVQNDTILRDLQYYLINDAGYRYTITLRGYNGAGSVIRANSLGNVTADCVPLYASVEGSSATCGTNYRLFFDTPAADLPPTAPSADGTLTVAPTLLTEDDLTVTDMAFQPAGPTATAGSFTYSITDRFQGGYKLQIDADGDGSFDEAVDRTIQLGADGTGTYSYDFDGLDGQGTPISDCTTINARILFDAAGEVHLLQQDVEGRSGGIQLTRTNGTGAPDSVIRWNDTNLTTAGRVNVTPELDGRAGVDSTGGIHGWPYAVNSWGDSRTIDDWAETSLFYPTGAIALPGQCLTITKTSDTPDARVGDALTYTVTATNDGDTAYTTGTPATVTDDLTQALTNATYNDDVTADRAGTLTTTDGKVTWAGALDPGDTVTLTYTITVTGAGDGRLRNVAYAGTPDQPTPACNQDDGPRDPATGIPCAVTETLLPRLILSKSANVDTVNTPGETITYTVTATNIGPGSFTDDAPAQITDDLTDVVDDATFDGTVSASTGPDPTYDAPTLTWAGALNPGDTVTLTYTATFAGGGDYTLSNAACIPVGDAAPGVAACATSTVTSPHIIEWKTSTPASGTTVTPGQQLTYTLHLENTGSAPGDVDTTDDLTHAIDDAVLVADPVSSTGDIQIGPFDDANRARITGTLEPGHTATITYTLRVRNADDLGDRTLSNFLVAPEDPAPTSPRCEDTSPQPLCTTHTVTLNGGGLAITGGPIIGGILAAALIACGVILAVVVRRRDQRTVARTTEGTVTA